MFEEMNKKGDFSYVGCNDEFIEKFYNGDCVMIIVFFGFFVNICEYVKFNYGVGMMFYDVDVKDVL